MTPDYVGAAFDLLTDSGLKLSVLSDEDRSAYLRDQASRLAPRLATAVEDFLANGLQPIAEWRRDNGIA